jgi:hypothetical protein
MWKRWTPEEERILAEEYPYRPARVIAEKLGRTISQVHNKAAEMGLKRKPSVSLDFFTKWSHEMAYVLGYWFADGCIMVKSGGHYFSLVSIDKEHLERIKSIMGIRTKIYKNTGRAYELRAGSKELYEQIKALGGVERKSSTVCCPEVPEPFRYDFIRGYYDGNGSAKLGYADYLTITFVSGSRPFLEGLADMMPDIETTILKDSRENNSSWLLRCYGIHAQRLAQRMYEGATLYIPRKLEAMRIGLERTYRNA